MNDFKVLKILDMFRKLFEKCNIDYPLMREVLYVKLLMDERRVVTIFSDTEMKKGNPFIRSLWLYALYGFIVLFFVFGNAYMLQMSIIFGVAMFILMTALIADFSTIILDVRDQAVMQTKPVDQRTIGVAKFMHILIYTVMLTGALTAVPILFMLFVHGVLFTILFVFMMLLLLLFSITFTSLVYIFVLKVFNGDRLKGMITSIQIIFAIGVIIGYQIIIRTYGVIDLEAAYLFKWWHIFLPPMWFAAPFELIMNKNGSQAVILLSLFSIVITAIAIFLYLKFMPTLQNQLHKLLETSSVQRDKKFSLENGWAKLLNRTRKTRTYFQFVYKIVDREREFKLKVYPSLGIGCVLPFLFLFSIVGDNSFEDIMISNLYLCIYFMQLFIGIAVYTFQFSGYFRGAWIFNMSEESVTYPLYEAVIKVFLVKLYLPMFLFVGIGYYFIFDKFHLIDLMVVFISGVIQALISFRLTMESAYPFSQPYDQLMDKENTIKAFLLMALTIPFALLHFLSTLIPFGLYLYFVLLFVGAVILWRLFLQAHSHRSLRL